jgi:hypothetical protein
LGPLYEKPLHDRNRRSLAGTTSAVSALHVKVDSFLADQPGAKAVPENNQETSYIFNKGRFKLS